MKLSEELFKLIKSLSRREKSYFKRYSNLYSDNPNKRYLKLFTVLDRMKVYDEKVLRAKLQEEGEIKHLSHEKSYLYKLLLRCLYSYDSKDTVEKRLRTQCEHIEVLIRRRLLSGALGFVDKALFEARTHEEFESWLELIKLKIQIYDMDWQAQRTDEVRELHLERVHVMQLMQNLDSYIQLRFEVFDLQSEGFINPSHPGENYLQLDQHKLLQHPEFALSEKALERYYYTINLIRFIARDFTEWHRGYKEYIAFMESNTALFQPKNFLQLYSNYLLACVKTRDADGFFSTLEKYEKIVALQTHDYQVHIAVLMSRIMEFHSISGDFASGIKYLSDMELKVDSWFEILPDFSKELLLMGAIRIWMENGRFERALKDINTYLQLDINTAGTEYLVVRLLKSICHTELEQYTLLDTELRSVYRILRKKHGLGPFETQFLRFLGKLPQAVNNKDVMPLLVSMRNKLEIMARDKSQNMILEYYHLIPWLDSKIQDRPFSETVIEYIRASAGEASS